MFEHACATHWCRFPRFAESVCLVCKATTLTAVSTLFLVSASILPFKLYELAGCVQARSWSGCRGVSISLRSVSSIAGKNIFLIPYGKDIEARRKGPIPQSQGLRATWKSREIRAVCRSKLMRIQTVAWTSSLYVHDLVLLCLTVSDGVMAAQFRFLQTSLSAMVNRISFDYWVSLSACSQVVTNLSTLAKVRV